MARRRWLAVLTLLLSAACIGYSSHVDEPLLPVATVTSDPTMVIYNVTSNGMDTTLTLNCTGQGTLAWFRGSPAEPVPNAHTTLINDTLVLEITPVMNGVDATEDGLPYFCTANNSLGTARSHTVTIIYAFFNGFSTPPSSVIDVHVLVDEEEAVGLSCSVQAAQPPPEIVWYKDNVIIDTTVAKYNTLDGGDTLVIYDIVTGDVTGVEYRCGVTNARTFETINSSTIYTLNATTLTSSQSIIYRQPRNRSVTLTEANGGLVFYYIGATSGSSTRGGAVDDANLFDAAADPDDLSVTLTNFDSTVSDSLIVQFFLRESSSGGSLADTIIDVMISFIDPLNIQQRPSDTMTVYHRFAMETISFTCGATGTVQLLWYKDGVRIEETSDLTFNNLTVDDSGVYQCFWEGEDGTRAMDTWALTVQQPMVPRDFSFTSTGITYPEGTIVPAGTTIQLTLTVTADSLPSIVWRFNSSSDNSITTIDFDISPSYNTSNVTRISDNEDLYEVSITIAVDSTTSGHYEAVVDDGRTEPTSSGRYFVSQEVDVSINSFEITTSSRCLLEGQMTTLVCDVVGLPPPTITFEKDNDDAFDCGDRCTILGSILTFTNPSSDDSGVYGCEADNGISPAVDVNLIPGSMMNMLQYCAPPTVTAVELMSVSEGEIATLSCTVFSEPTASTEVFWFKDNGTTPLQDNDRINIGTSGDSTHELRISDATAADQGTYKCVANNTLIPSESAANITLTITESTSSPTPLPIYVPIVAAVGGLIVVLVVVAIVVFVCMCCCNIGKRESYSTRKTSGDYTDGRGNVDADSDEEDHQYHNEPEEFQPQYESLPVLRPAQPPEYKPSPAYNNFGPMDDMEMVKVPPPDTESTAFEYNPHSQGYLPNTGPMTSSSMGIQARFDDFITEDSQFV